MATATTRLLDAIRAANGNCTDYRAGKLLGTTTASVSRWRTEVGHMSIANVSKACEIAGIPDQTWEWQIRIGAEREKGPDGDLYREALRDLDSYRTTGQPSPNGLISMILRSAHAAAILATVLLVSAFIPSGKIEAQTVLSDAPHSRGFCILCEMLRGAVRRRLRRRWRRLLTRLGSPLDLIGGVDRSLQLRGRRDCELRQYRASNRLGQQCNRLDRQDHARTTRQDFHLASLQQAIPAAERSAINNLRIELKGAARWFARHAGSPSVVRTLVNSSNAPAIAAVPLRLVARGAA